MKYDACYPLIHIKRPVVKNLLSKARLQVPLNKNNDHGNHATTDLLRLALGGTLHVQNYEAPMSKYLREDVLGVIVK